MASKVYFADLRADYHENLQQKLTRLMKTAGMGDIDFNQGSLSYMYRLNFKSTSSSSSFI